MVSLSKSEEISQITRYNDVVFSVVDAAEGPLEQTLESIDAVKKARVSLVVAINKIDKPNADVEATKKALHEAGVQLEDFGGDVQAIPISALNGDGVEDLIEALLAQSEVLQLSADPKGPVEGSIIESNMELGLGKTATVLVKRGTLTKGKFLVCGSSYGKVKQVLDTRAPISESTGKTSAYFPKFIYLYLPLYILAERKEIKKVLPSEACRITGWKELPKAGDVFLEVKDEKRAQEVVRWRKEQEKEQNELEMFKIIESKRREENQIYQKYRLQKLEKGNIHHPVFGVTSEARNDLVRTMSVNEDAPKVSIVIKTDVNGSLEAIEDCLATYDSDEVLLDIASVGVGDISENDLKLAKDNEGIVYAYNIPVTDQIRKTASYIGVTVREFNVVYALIDDLKDELSSKMPLSDAEDVVGKGTVGKEYVITEKGQKIPVGGCHINSGSFNVSKSFRIIRGATEIFDGKLASLKHLKEEKNVIPSGKDCGIMLEDSSLRFSPGDVVVCYETRKEKREIDWVTGF